MVVFNLVPAFLNATFRTWAFLTKGLQEAQSLLEEVPFDLVWQPLQIIEVFLEIQDTVRAIER